MRMKEKEDEEERGALLLLVYSAVGLSDLQREIRWQRGD
jgi:hypothetical protein